MTTHIFWNEVKSLVKDAYQTDKDLIDEMSMTENEKEQLVAQDKKVSSVARTSFKKCSSIQDFHEIAQMNLETLRQAATVLRGGDLDDKDKLPFTEALLFVANNRFKGRKEQIADKLLQYASFLEPVYEDMEQDLLANLKIKGRHVRKEDWIISAKEAYSDAPNNLFFSDGLERNFREGKVKLFDNKGELIPLSEYQGKEGDPVAFFNYLEGSVIKELVVQLGMINEENEEAVLNEEAEMILSHFALMAENLKTLEQKLDVSSTDPKMKKEILTQKVRTEMKNLFQELDKTENGKQIAFLLTSFGEDVANVFQNKTENLVTVIEPKEGEPKLELDERLIEVHFPDKKGPQILFRDLYKYSTSEKEPNAFIELISDLKLDPSDPSKLQEDHRFTLTGRSTSEGIQILRKAVSLAGFNRKVDQYKVKEETSLALVVGRPGLRTVGETSFLTEIKSINDLQDEIYQDSISVIGRIATLAGFFKIPPEISSQMIVRRAIEAELLLSASGSKLSEQGKISLLLYVYAVDNYPDLPKEVRDLVENERFVENVTENFFAKYDPVLKSIDDVRENIGKPAFREAYITLINQLADRMATTTDEWIKITMPVENKLFLSDLEKQLRFMGLHRLDPKELKVIMDTALVTGIVKGTNPRVLDIVYGFLEIHAPKSRGLMGYFDEDLDVPLSIATREEIKAMKTKEMAFSELCLYYDQNVSNFSEIFRQRILEMLELICEYRDVVENKREDTDVPLPTTIEEMAEREFSAMEPFQGDYYQGSIPIERIPQAIRNEKTNFRTKMWICANMDDVFEHFFVHEYPDGKLRLDAFEEFMKKNHPEIEWIDFNKIRAQFKISDYVTRTMIHREELDEFKGRSIFHPRHPLTTHSRETGEYHERVQRKKVEQTLRMQEEEAFEEHLRRHDIAQQNILPLSLEEIERHQPELYLMLEEKYNGLKTPKDREEAMNDDFIYLQDVIPTKWGSGGWVWAMNEGTLVSKQNGETLHASPITKMLTRSVPMSGGISGHIEFIEHLATYFGMNRQDALITTFANLVLCNAHTVPEVVVGCSSFIGIMPSSVLDKLEFNETMFPTLANWVMSRVSESNPSRKHLEELMNDISPRIENVD